jgi:uncharacterized membrane protein
MGIWWLLIILLIIAAVVWIAVITARRNGATVNGGIFREDTPEQAAKRRYAKGEIDRETYLRIVEDLRK